MAIVREIDSSDTYLTYLSTIAFFCGISCTIVMIRFKGFKASLNLSSGKSNGKHYEVAPQTSVVGAYRTSREEYFGNINYLESRKTITPSMVKLPPNAQSKAVCPVKPSKSTGDLTTVQNVPPEVRKSTPNVNVQNASNGKQTKDQSKAQKKLEKEQQIEQKKREKLAAQERDKQEKLRKEREKKAAEQQAKEAKEIEKQKKRKGAAPQPKPQTQSQQQPTTQQKETPQQKPTKRDQRGQQPQQKREAPPPPQFKKVTQRVQLTSIPQLQTSAQNTRYSLESSISRSSGPPPYSDNPETNKIDSTGNISFVKPAEVSSSWDMISQHRQQMSRTTPATVHSSKQKTMDLRYNVTNNDRDNSEA